jgi:IclR family mhp operon transcriptional activator
MESTRPIRALMRGLDALTVLNLRDGATVSEVVQEIRLPRTTVYRILETLCDAGFVYRDATDDRYRLTILVRGLSDGFDDEAWVTQIAKPFLHELSHEVVWPVAIATLSGTSMLVRETTDHSSPLAIERYSAGFRVPLLTSATGLVYLAHCPAAQRETLIEILARSKKPTEGLSGTRAELAESLAEIRNQGYATVNRSRPIADDVTISVPVALAERVLAGLTIRYTAAALPLPAAVGRFVPKLRECANKIRNVLAEQQAEARRKDASAAVN